MPADEARGDISERLCRQGGFAKKSKMLAMKLDGKKTIPRDPPLISEITLKVFQWFCVIFNEYRRRQLTAKQY